MPRITISDIDLKRGERLRKFRIDKNFTRKDLGRIAGGYAQGTVYNWEEKGGGIPNLALVNLRKIDCDLIYILTGRKDATTERNAVYGESDPASVSVQGESEESEAEASSQIDAIYHLQRVLSEIQFILSAAGHHMEAGQSLKSYADLGGLISSLRELTDLNEEVVSILEEHRCNGVGASNQSLREKEGDNPAMDGQGDTA